MPREKKGQELPLYVPAEQEACTPQCPQCDLYLQKTLPSRHHHKHKLYLHEVLFLLYRSSDETTVQTRGSPNQRRSYMEDEGPTIQRPVSFMQSNDMHDMLELNR